MARTLNFKNLSCLLTLMVALSFVTGTLSAQNLIVNGEFEAGHTGFYTDYTYTYGNYVVEAGHYRIDNTTSGYGGGGGWPQPANSHGKFMMVNGFGNTGTNKIVWQQTVNVTTQTRYTLSYRVANLNQAIYGQIYPAKIQVEINGSPLGGNNTLPSNNNWHDWSNTWYNSNSTQVTITIIDVCESNPGYGDDFCLDDISFVPQVFYNVTAVDDDTEVCLNNTVTIPVLNNDNVLPSGNNNNVSISILTPLNQIDGTTTLPTINSNNTISYTYNDANYTGNSANFQYKVTWHGVASTAWVNVSLRRAPTIGDIGLSSPIILCEGSSLTLPTVTANSVGTPITNQGWQVKINGSWQNLTGNTIPSITSEYTSVRYYASNQCDDVYSEEYQIELQNAPSVGSISNIIPTTICAPSPFSFTPPNIQSIGSAPFNPQWQMQIGGQWVNAPNTIEYEHNGCSVRYYVENDCGPAYSNVVQLTVNAEPIVGSIASSPTGICEHTSFNLTPPQVTWRHNDPSTCSGSWEIQVDGIWQPLTNSNIPFAYNGCSIRYKAVNGCGITYSPNTVPVTVYSTAPINEGEITACDAIYHHGVLCDSVGIYIIDSITPNGCPIQVSWQFNLGEDYVAPMEFAIECDEYYWSHSHTTYNASGIYNTTVVNGDPMICDSTFTLNLTINHAPVFTEDLQTPSDICVGQLVGVHTPSFVMNQSGGTQRWDYATSANGPFQSFDPTTYHMPYGSYFLRFVVINDCDSIFSNVVQFHVNDEPMIEGQLGGLQVCEGNPLDLPDVNVIWRNYDEDDRFSEWQMANANGVFAHFDPLMPLYIEQNGCLIRFYAQNSCGEAILGPVPITVLSVEDQWLDPISACDSYPLQSGEVITESQMVEYEVYEPCLHTVYQPIVINHSDFVQYPFTSCQDSYDWHGHHFERSDVTQYAQFDTVNRYGCDSIVELQLNFGAYNEFTENWTSCEPFEWSLNPGHIYYESQRDSVFVPGTGPDDCDSWYYLVLTLGSDTLVEGDEMEECSGFMWHGVPYYEDAIVYDSLLTAVTRCDSIVSHYLRIIQPIDTSVVMESCTSFWWQGYLFEEDGDVFSHTFTSQQGCDSVVTVHFSLVPAIEMPTEEVFVCEPFVWEPSGQTISENGLWSYTYHVGCDSIVSINVTFNETEVISDFVSACNEYSFLGQTYHAGVYQIYYDTLYYANGCDSIVHCRNLTVKDIEHMGTISGYSSVYVATNLISGVYRYTIDNTGLSGNVTWSLDNPDWRVLDSDNESCQILVTTPGCANLIAHFMVEDCGEMEKRFFINAGFYDVEEKNAIEVNIYPNPSDGLVTVEADGIESIRVINMMGQTLDVQEYGLAESVRLNLSGYTLSVYLFEIKTVNGWVRKRVVLCR